MSDDTYKNKRVVVTGGMGFVGRNLVDGLIKAHAASITVIDDCSNSSDVPPSHWPMQIVNIVKQSVLDVAWDDYTADSDIIFHLACKTVLECDDNPILDLEVNTKSTVLILESIRRRPVNSRPTLIYTSTACVYGKTPNRAITEDEHIEPNHQYGVSKLASEKYMKMYAQTHGLRTGVLRLSNVYGPYQTPRNPYCGVIGIFLDQAEKGSGLSVIGDGMQVRDFTFAEDTVGALLAVGLKDDLSGDVFNVSTGTAVSINDLAGVVTGLYENCKLTHLPLRHVDDIHYRLLDSSKIKKYIGKESFTKLEDGIAQTIDWIRQQ